MRTRWCVTLFLYCLCEELTVLAFNLEPRIPVVKKGVDGSYFGYSVAEHVILNRRAPTYDPKVLVGAPKAQGRQEGTNHSGAIYVCPLTTRDNDCQMISIDDSYLVDDGELKDHQWLGVTLKSQGLGGFVLTCAHRYMKKGYNYRWGTGICYSLTQQLDPGDTFEPCESKPKARAHEEFGYCQVGTSGAISEANDIILGTPGPYTWRGTVFINNIGSDLQADRGWYQSAVVDREAPVDKYGYLGMSVTTGKFFKDRISYIAGAPRANNTGQVIFFSKRSSSPTLEVDVTLNGEIFASSYGYEVAAADLNGDGTSDLIVGAPFYYGKDGGGAIYVYISPREGINEKTNYVRIVGNKEGEPRFGFAIANCKDLNKDSFEDIAVGAPYEGNGHVYIFLGSVHGIVKEPAQIIKAEDLPIIPLRSFGYSLSGGIDLDQNTYPDLVVGAYESDKVLVLRGRPIIQIESSIKGDLTNIDPGSRTCTYEGSPTVCVSFQACFIIKFNETRHAPALRLNYTIEAETFSGKRTSRVYFETNSEPKNVVHQNISLPAGRPEHYKCIDETFHLHDKIRDILTPIQFRLTYSLLQDELTMPRHGAPLPNINNYPILNQQEAVRNFQATFERDCGDEEECVCDLTVTVEMPKDREFILGSKGAISMTVGVRNKLYSAYEAAIYIYYSNSLTYQTQNKESKMHHFCDTINDTVISCALGNPFKHLPEFTRITVSFYPSKVKDTDTSLKFTVIANTTSKEKHPTSPIVEHLAIKRVADLSIKGQAEPDQVFYSGEVRGESVMKTEEDVGNPLVHRYGITNKGPSHVSLLYVNISWPYETATKDEHGKWLLYLMEEPRITGGSGECKYDPKHVNTLSLTKAKSIKLGSHDFHHLIWSMDIDKKHDGDSGVDGEDSIGAGGGGSVSGTGGSGVVEGGGAISGGEIGGGGTYEYEEREEKWTSTVSKTKWSHNVTTTREETIEYSGSGHRGKRDVQPSAEPLSDKGVILDCRDGTAKCFTIICYIRNFLPDANINVNIWLRGRLWSSTFVADYADVERVTVISRAYLFVDTIPEIKQENLEDDHSFAETKAIPDFPASQKKKDVPIWIYILAALFGLFLLVLVILCLWKLGFFKRKTPRDTMKANLEKQNEFNSHNY